MTISALAPMCRFMRPPSGRTLRLSRCVRVLRRTRSWQTRSQSLAVGFGGGGFPHRAGYSMPRANRGILNKSLARLNQAYWGFNRFCVGVRGRGRTFRLAQRNWDCHFEDGADPSSLRSFVPESGES